MLHPVSAPLTSSSTVLSKRFYDGVPLTLRFLEPNDRNLKSTVTITPDMPHKSGAYGSVFYYSPTPSPKTFVVIKLPIANDGRYLASMKREINNLTMMRVLDSKSTYHVPMIGMVKVQEGGKEKLVGFVSPAATSSLSEAIPLADFAGKRTLLGCLQHVYQGLLMLHSKGYIHGDIKAANMVVVDSSGHRNIKLIDFATLTEYNTDSSREVYSTFPPLSVSSEKEGVRKCKAIPYADEYAWALVCMSVIESPNAVYCLSHDRIHQQTIVKLNMTINRLQIAATLPVYRDPALRQVIGQAIDYLSRELNSISSISGEHDSVLLGGAGASQSNTPIVARHTIAP